MHSLGTWALAAAAAVFAVFIANVFIGASGGTVFLSDVAEMLTLFLASVLFVVAIVEREAEAKDERKKSPQGRNTP